MSLARHSGMHIHKHTAESTCFYRHRSWFFAVCQLCLFLFSFQVERVFHCLPVSYLYHPVRCKRTAGSTAAHDLQSTGTTKLDSKSFVWKESSSRRSKISPKIIRELLHTPLLHRMVLLSKRRKVGGLAAAVILCVAGKLGFDQVRTMPQVLFQSQAQPRFPPYFPSLAVECVARTLLGNKFSETHVAVECSSSFTPGAPTLVTARDRMITYFSTVGKRRKETALIRHHHTHRHTRSTCGLEYTPDAEVCDQI